MSGTPAEKINRQNLVADLQNYSPTPEEEKFIPQFLNLLQSPRCYYRDYFEPGHITGSAVLLNKNGDKILMNHHKTLNRWLNFGGHADGDEDILAVAIRETMEESGLTAFQPVSIEIADIDIHPIPANDKRHEPEHYHFDIRYIMQMTADQKPIISDESTALQWMTFDEALKEMNSNDSLTRLINKARM